MFVYICFVLFTYTFITIHFFFFSLETQKDTSLFENFHSTNLMTLETYKIRNIL